jgi:sporulation protein YlmC with PRC-barrel domain
LATQWKPGPIPDYFRIKETYYMKRSTLAGSVAACICLGLTAPLLAAPPAATSTGGPVAASAEKVPASKPAEQCLTDLRAFDSQLEKDGYWIGGSGYGYGYPMGGYGYGRSGPISGSPTGTAPMAMGYQSSRPGYEVRTLIASANILAQHGQQAACENVLATTREIYKVYAADLHNGNMPMVNVDGWRHQQIADAQPVTDKTTAFRSDELVGTEVRNPKGEALGSVEDLVMSPQTGKIAYMVIARGGIFGFDQSYVPVPWGDFKVTPNGNLLVLDTTKTAMEAAPRVGHDQVMNPAEFDQQSGKVDAYWKTHMSTKATTGSNG